MKGVLALYWVTLKRLKSSSWGKNSLFMIIGIIIAVGTLTLSMILFESYEKTLVNAFKVAQPDILINHNYMLTEGNQEELESILDAYKSEIRAIEQKQRISVIINRGDSNKPAYIESFSEDNTNFNQLMYSFSKQKDFHLSDNEIILGEYLAKELNVQVGEEVNVIIPSSIRYSIFGLVKKAEKFLVRDIERTGLYEIDVYRAIVNKSRVELLVGDNDSGISTYLLWNDRSQDNSRLVAGELNRIFMNRLPQVQAFDLISKNSVIFSALSLQKVMIFLILCIIVIVASFNVISTVSTIINEKINEIGILMTLGLKRKEIKFIYFTFSLILAHIGIVIGLILGYGSAYWLTSQDYFSLKGDIYFIDKILINPSALMFLTIYITTIFVISTTIFLSLRNINKLEIISIMRQ